MLPACDRRAFLFRYATGTLALPRFIRADTDARNLLRLLREGLVPLCAKRLIAFARRDESHFRHLAIG